MNSGYLDVNSSVQSPESRNLSAVQHPASSGKKAADTKNGTTYSDANPIKRRYSPMPWASVYNTLQQVMKPLLGTATPAVPLAAWVHLFINSTFPWRLMHGNDWTQSSPAIIASFIYDPGGELRHILLEALPQDLTAAITHQYDDGTASIVCPPWMAHMPSIAKIWRMVLARSPYLTHTEKEEVCAPKSAAIVPSDADGSGTPIVDQEEVEEDDNDDDEEGADNEDSEDTHTLKRKSAKSKGKAKMTEAEAEEAVVAQREEEHAEAQLIQDEMDHEDIAPNSDLGRRESEAASAALAE
ncbi:hypothetical protein FIBSPDRAFT_902755 [Athelia psychrophila]|uniref:Uncharacterized protein n=1 Tax=Athelia psychrophila TaxID=1759441 RepID=A0A167WV72_9AGAM|nr:hypothetical protein FIBSPDRAFT_902755 [Fibularhizoctonia sp. CBS 109695]